MSMSTSITLPLVVAIALSPVCFPLSPTNQVFGPRTPRLPSFVFVSVFKWELRKGYDVLLKAFLQEFTSRQQHPAPPSPQHGGDSGGELTAAGGSGDGGNVRLLGAAGSGRHHHAHHSADTAEQQGLVSSRWWSGDPSPYPAASGPVDVALYIVTKPFLSAGLDTSIPGVLYITSLMRNGGTLIIIYSRHPVHCVPIPGICVRHIRIHPYCDRRIMIVFFYVRMLYT